MRSGEARGRRRMKEEEGLVSFKVVGSGLLSTEFCFVRRSSCSAKSILLFTSLRVLSFFFHDRIIHISIIVSFAPRIRKEIVWFPFYNFSDKRDRIPAV